MVTDEQTSRQAQATESMNRIYETAVDLLREKGFESVSIAEICRRAGVSVGLFYYYFPSKIDILKEKFRRADCYFNDQVRNSLTEGSITEKIRNYIRTYLSYVESEGVDLIRNFYTTSNTFFVQRGRPMQDVLITIITAGQQQNTIRADMDPETCVDFIFTVLRGIIFDWSLRNGSYSITTDTARHVDMILGYLTS